MGRRVFRHLALVVSLWLIYASSVGAQGMRVLPDLFAPLSLAQVEADIGLPRAELAPPEVSENTGMPRFDSEQEGGSIGIAQLAIESSQYVDPRYIENSQHPDDPGIWEKFRTGYGDQAHRLVQDYKNFYLSERMLYLGAMVAVAAPFANTHADQGIRDWYQRGAGQSAGAKEAADVFRQFGEYKYAVPVYLVLGATGFIWDDVPILATAGNFGNRTLRAMMVGAPTVGMLQLGLGSSRPYTGDSHWHPFRSNKGVAGHGFIGALPFLTAASMTDNYALKTLLVAGSFGTSWSRIQHDGHYFSQVILGWSIAYLAVQSVNQTEADPRFRIVPCCIPQGVNNAMGMGIEFHF